MYILLLDIACLLSSLLAYVITTTNLLSADMAAIKRQTVTQQLNVTSCNWCGIV